MRLKIPKKYTDRTIDMNDLGLASVIQANPGFKESILIVARELRELRAAGFTLEDDEEHTERVCKKHNHSS